MPAIKFESAPVLEGPWDSEAADQRLRKWASSDDSGTKEMVDWNKYGSGFTWSEENPKSFGAFKLPHHDIDGGELKTSRRGLFACASVLQGGRGGVDISEADITSVKSHIAKHYHDLDLKAPWETDDVQNELCGPTPQASKTVQLMAFNVSSEGDTLTLDVYETIGNSFLGDSISAKDVLGKLRDTKPNTIKVRINSGGGDLFDGIAIHNLLRASGAKISVSVDGVAASAASVIAIAADPGELTIAEGAFLMIHEARGGLWGTAAELETASKLVRKANSTMAEMYSKAAAKRGVSVDAATFAALMAEETWLMGDEALLIGLADRVSEAPSLAASIDVSAFRKAPQRLSAQATEKPPVVISVPAPSVEPDAQKIPAPIQAPQETDMSKELEAALEAHKAELVALTKANETLANEAATHKSAAEKLTVENSALKSQNETLAAERDKALADIAARDAKLLEQEVDALIPNVLDSIERDNFIALAKTSRTLFDSMIAQRKPRNLTIQLVNTELPTAEGNAAVGADAKFDELVAKDLT